MPARKPKASRNSLFSSNALEGKSMADMFFFTRSNISAAEITEPCGWCAGINRHGVEDERALH